MKKAIERINRSLDNFFLDPDLDFGNWLAKMGCVVLFFFTALCTIAVCFPKDKSEKDLKLSDDEAVEAACEYYRDSQKKQEEPPVESFYELYHENFSADKEESSVSEEPSVPEKDESPSADDTSKSIKDSPSGKKSLDFYQKRAKNLNLPEDYNVEKAIQGMQYLTEEQNFSEEGAAGIIGNLFSESRFDGSEEFGSHKGIAQWDSNRWPLIEDWLYVNEYKDHSFLGQLIAIFESKDGEHFQETFHAMRKMADAEVAAMYWLERYEKAPGQAEEERQWIAQLTYELYAVNK